MKLENLSYFHKNILKGHFSFRPFQILEIFRAWAKGTTFFYPTGAIVEIENRRYLFAYCFAFYPIFLIVPFLFAVATYLHRIHNAHSMKIVNSKTVFLYSKMNNNDYRLCEQSVRMQHLFGIESMRWKSRERFCWNKDRGLAACCLMLTTYSALACQLIVAKHLTNENVRWCEIQWTIRVVPSARVQQNIITNNV